MKKRKKNKLKIALKNKKTWVVIILIFLVSIGTVFGRYIYLEIRDFYLNSKRFYFNGDKMTVQGTSYALDNWSGVDEYPITFSLNSFKNNAIAADEAIPYVIRYDCPTTVTCTITKTSGTIPTTTHTDEFTLTITPKPGFSASSVTVYVEAESTAPYVKKIKGHFTLNVGTIGVNYSIDDVPGRTYFMVNITNTLDFYKARTAFGDYAVGDPVTIDEYNELSAADKAKCASILMTLSFNPSVVLLDMTTPAYLKMQSSTTTSIGGYDYLNSLTFAIDPLDSEAVKFYKLVTANNYTYPFVTSTPIVTVSYT